MVIALMVLPFDEEERKEYVPIYTHDETEGYDPLKKAVVLQINGIGLSRSLIFVVTCRRKYSFFSRVFFPPEFFVARVPPPPPMFFLPRILKKKLGPAGHAKGARTKPHY
jgi:hypothetical protein